MISAVLLFDINVSLSVECFDSFPVAKPLKILYIIGQTERNSGRRCGTGRIRTAKGRRGKAQTNGTEERTDETGRRGVSECVYLGIL